MAQVKEFWQFGNRRTVLQSQTHRVKQFGRDFWTSTIRQYASSMASWIEMPSTASNEDRNISKDKDPTASLGSLLLGLITVMVNHFYPTSGQNLPCCNVCLSASHPCTGHLGNLIHILQIGNSKHQHIPSWAKSAVSVFHSVPCVPVSCLSSEELPACSHFSFTGDLQQSMLLQVQSQNCADWEELLSWTYWLISC